VRTHIYSRRYDLGMANPDDWREEEGILAWSAFLRAYAAVVRRIEAEVGAKAGLPLGWYDVLLELNAAPQRRMRMQELGEAAVLSRSRVSRIVDELVAAGLAERQPNPDDRRSSYAVITAEGRKVLRRAAPLYMAAVRRHFVAALRPDQVAAVRAAMEALLAS
jgi:DNA-binding MarR family transcriptional regulator